MTVFTCEHDWMAMLTCIYTAMESKLMQQNIRLELEPIYQYSLIEDYVHVEPDANKAEKLMDAIVMKISPALYETEAYCSMFHEPDVLDNIYRVLLLGFYYGPKVLDMMQYKDVMRNIKIRKSLSNEICHFQEFSRFHEVSNSIYVSHIEPRSRLVQALGPAFADRMPSEHWMIVDDVHMEALIHPKNEEFYLRRLTEDEYNRLLLTENENDEYTDMWKAFFNSVSIKERENYRCQRNHIPLWTRKHSVEFMS